MMLLGIGTGSKGNCYALQRSNGKVLLIDAGVSYGKIVASLLEVGIDPTNIDAVIVSHSHTDHCRSLKYFKQNVKMYTNWESDKIVQVTNDVVIRPFPVKHDVECYGFVIDVITDQKRILYVTDFSKIPNNRLINGYFNLVLIECNWDENGMHKRASINRSRSVGYHCSDVKAAQILQNIQYARCLHIHMSGENLDRSAVDMPDRTGFIGPKMLYHIED